MASACLTEGIVSPQTEPPCPCIRRLPRVARSAPEADVALVQPSAAILQLHDVIAVEAGAGTAAVVAALGVVVGHVLQEQGLLLVPVGHRRVGARPKKASNDALRHNARMFSGYLPAVYG